jgi:hypothetical protein
MGDEYEDDLPAPPPRPRRPRKPIDWTLWIMIVGTLLFILVFGAITLGAPRRPFLALRGLGPSLARPAPAAVATGAAATAVPGAATAAPKP